MGLWFVAPDPQFAVLALGLSGLAIFFSELGFMFYNALLPRLADASITGRISGYGWGLGYIGAILALILVLAIFILPEPSLFGLSKAAAEPVRAAMIFAGLWLVIFSLPLFFTSFEEGPKKQAQPFMLSLIQSGKLVLSIPNMMRFLIARMAYNDGFDNVVCLWRYLCRESVWLYPARYFDLRYRTKYHSWYWRHNWGGR